MFLPSNLFVVYEVLPLVFQFQHCAKCTAAVGVGSHLGDIPHNRPGIMAKMSRACGGSSYHARPSSADYSISFAERCSFPHD